LAGVVLPLMLIGGLKFTQFEMETAFRAAVIVHLAFNPLKGKA
jgi:hypothetical protein